PSEAKREAARGGTRNEASLPLHAVGITRFANDDCMLTGPPTAKRCDTKATAVSDGVTRAASILRSRRDQACSGTVTVTPSRRYAPQCCACSRARFSKRVYSFKKVSATS